MDSAVSVLRELSDTVAVVEEFKLGNRHRVSFAVQLSAESLRANLSLGKSAGVPKLKSSTWVLLAVCNLVAVAGAAYLVAISGKLAAAIPGLIFLFVLDLRACHRLLQQSDDASAGSGPKNVDNWQE